MGAMRAISPGWLAVLGALGLGACGDNNDRPADAGPSDAMADATLPPDGNPLTPPTLAGTGLCTNPQCTTFAADVFEYKPRFELWSDSATKRRWIYLPPGATIDTSDMDYWKFPVGTKLWKEFTRDGVRVETRYIAKIAADDNDFASWFYTTYQWNAAQDATTTADAAGVMNANGTEHDIPSRTNCRECHDSYVPSRILGFGAISLDYAAGADLLDLEDLIAMGKLSAPPTGGTAGARYPLPGTATDQAALGYLHANCGHCHNPTSGNFGHTPTDMRLTVGTLGSVATTPAYTTMVDKTGLTLVEGNKTYTTLIDTTTTDDSILLVRLMLPSAPRKMPQRGSEMIDTAGMATLRAWIDSL